MTRLLRPLLVPFLALIAVWAFFYEYLPPFQKVHFFSDIEIYHYPIQRYAFQALKEGRLPQWDASMYCGIPFAGNPQAALFYPPMWLLYAAYWRHTIFPYTALEYFAIAHVWLALLLCYGWLRSRGIERFPSGLGAVAFGFGGYFLWQIVHLGVTMSLPWMPLAFWGIDEATKKDDWRPLWKTTIASAMWFLAGYPPSWAGFCIAIVVYALASPGRVRVAAWSLAAIAASILLAMVQVLPAIEASLAIYRQTRYFATAGNVVAPLFVANWTNSNPGSSRHYLECLYVYLGLPTIFGLIWAVTHWNWRRYLQPLVVVAVCLVLVGDPHYFVYHTIRHVSIIERTLQSYNFYEAVAAMGALIAAMAVGDFLKKAPRAAPKWMLPAAALGMAGWSAWEIGIWVHGGNFATGWRAALETAVALALFAAAVWTVRSESGRRRHWMAVLAMLFVVSDFKVYGTNRLFNTRDGNGNAGFDTVEIQGMDPEVFRRLWNNRHYRVSSDGGPSHMELRMWGLASPQGLDPLLPARYRERIERWGAEFQTTRVFRMVYESCDMLQTLGVRYAISYEGAPHEAFLAASPDFRLIGRPDSFYRVYEYLRARAPYGWDGTIGEVSPTEWIPERRVFKVWSKQGGRFTLTEQFAPGWRATIDGKATPITQWNETFQSIDVGPGEHQVVFEYRSRWMPLGGVISAETLVALVCLVLLKRGSGMLQTFSKKAGNA